MNHAIFNKQFVQAIYDKRAANYDQIVRLLSCGTDTSYRKLAISLLAPGDGDNILDFGCGTGSNIRFINNYSLNTRIIATDYSLGMLKVARDKNKAYSNVSFIQADDFYACFKKQSVFTKVISTYTLSTLNNIPNIIRTFQNILVKEGSLVISDDRLPEGWFLGPKYLLKGLIKRKRDTYSIIIKELNRGFKIKTVKEVFCGLIYVIKATKT